MFAFQFYENKLFAFQFSKNKLFDFVIANAFFCFIHIIQQKILFLKSIEYNCWYIRIYFYMSLQCKTFLQFISILILMSESRSWLLSQCPPVCRDHLGMAWILCLATWAGIWTLVAQPIHHLPSTFLSLLPIYGGRLREC